MVKLLKFIDNEWRVVDYGVKAKINIYTALGYVVQTKKTIASTKK